MPNSRLRTQPAVASRVTLASSGVVLPCVPFHAQRVCSNRRSSITDTNLQNYYILGLHFQLAAMSTLQLCIVQQVVCLQPMPLLLPLDLSHPHSRSQAISRPCSGYLALCGDARLHLLCSYCTYIPHEHARPTTASVPEPSFAIINMYSVPIYGFCCFCTPYTLTFCWRTC